MLTLPILPDKPVTSRNRRKAPRKTLASPLQGRIPLLNISVTLIDYGADGGFAIQSHHHLPIGSVHDLNFTMADGKQISVTARVAHSLLASSATPPLFFTGFTSEKEFGLWQAEQKR